MTRLDHSSVTVHINMNITVYTNPPEQFIGCLMKDTTRVRVTVAVTGDSDIQIGD